MRTVLASAAPGRRNSDYLLVQDPELSAGADDPVVVPDHPEGGWTRAVRRPLLDLRTVIQVQRGTRRVDFHRLRGTKRRRAIRQDSSTTER